MVYADFSNLPRKTPSGRELWDKVFKSAKNSENYNSLGLASKVYKFFCKRFSIIANKCAAATHTETINSFNSEHNKLTEEMHKPIIKKFARHKKLLL